MLTIFTHPDKNKLLAITLVENTLEGVNMDTNGWSTRVVVQTEQQLQLPLTLNTALGKVTLEAVYNKGVKSLIIPVSQKLKNDKGEEYVKGTACLATAYPPKLDPAVMAYFHLLNSRIFGVLGHANYRFDNQVTASLSVPAPAVPAIPALVGSMSLANGVTNSAEDSAVPKAPVDDLPF